MTQSKRAPLRTETISLPQLAFITAFLCVFVVPAVRALMMIVNSPIEALK
jgi:hypothetical protein